MFGSEFLAPISQNAIEWAQAEAMAARKRLAWERRKRVVVEEVLRIAHVSPEDTEFLLGRTDVDPNPRRRIVYPELTRGREVLEIPEDIIPSGPLFHEAPLRRQQRPQATEVREAVQAKPLPTWTKDMELTFDRQFRFRMAVGDAIRTASRDMTTREYYAVTGQELDGFFPVDPHPERIPKYHALVPETPVYIAK